MVFVLYGYYLFLFEQSEERETAFRLFLRFSTQMLLKLRRYFYNPISEFIYISG